MLAQRVAYGTNRRLRYWLQRPAITRRPTASRGPLLRRIGVARPRGPDLGEVPRAVRLALDTARLLRAAHGRLAHPEVPGELAIAGCVRIHTVVEKSSDNSLIPIVFST
jgi:hypothetical protein